MRVAGQITEGAVGMTLMRRFETPQSRWVLVCVGMACLWGCSFADGDLGAQPPDDAPKRPANRLSRETSPYLLLHAHNPVDWYPWGPEALERARREDKPIFLSIGYSSCYWCHVMERLVFSNPEIARYMNEHFVNIKVDREERPDVDEVYMTALLVYYRALGAERSGGWPLSLFLTPDAKPLGGGTYFPPEDTENHDGFPTLMRKVSATWKEKRTEMEANADFLAKAVQATGRPRLVLNGAEVNRELVTTVVQNLRESFDPEYGGFEFNPAQPDRPKFPVPVKLALLQYETGRENSAEAAKILALTLDRMADGGIHDQIGGGFHRYSTDRYWRVPHFEKMLYDNAQLADVYVEAYRQTQNPRYRHVAQEIFTFVLRELTDRDGGFYSALDAETDGVEGKFYIWTRAQLEKSLSAGELRLCERIYGLDQEPNFEDAYVLEMVRSPEAVAAELELGVDECQQQLETIRAKLLKTRNQRKSLLRDDKILTSWNGLMIRALAHGSVVLKRPEYRLAAEKAAMFLLTRLRDDKGRLLRTYRAGQAKLPAYLDDYAFLVEGLLALQQATGDEKWLNAASRLSDDQFKLFWDEQRQGCFFTATDHEELLVRSKILHDTVLPSGNSVTARNLLRLAALTHQPAYRTRAQRMLAAFAPQIKESPRGFANLALAVGEYLDDPDFAAAARPRPDARRQPAAGIVLTGGQAEPPKKPAKMEHVQGKAYLSVDRLPAGGTCQVLLYLKIDEPWHINANPPTDEFAVPTELSLKSKQGVKLGAIRYPAAEKLEVKGQDEPLLIYRKQAVIRATLEIPAAAAGKSDELTFQLDYQACNDTTCLRPQKLTLTLPVAVARKGEPVKAINEKLFNPPKKN
jgi:hypothetical protein